MKFVEEKEMRCSEVYINPSIAISDSLSMHMHHSIHSIGYQSIFGEYAKAHRGLVGRYRAVDCISPILHCSIAGRKYVWLHDCASCISGSPRISTIWPRSSSKIPF